MTVKFTSPGSMTQITMESALQTLADNTAAESSSTESNDDSAERMFFRNFAFKLGTQGGARGASAKVYLVLAPYLGTIQADKAAINADDDDYINNLAHDKDGNPVIWHLDAAVTARDLTWANVSIPNSDYFPTIVNRTNVAFAGTNELWASAAFSVENVT